MKCFVISAILLAVGSPLAANNSADKAATAAMADGKGALLGEIAFVETNAGVLLKVDLEGLPPGPHAIHIHEKGACEAPDFKSAGGHFNPSGASHGYLDGKAHHAGDMPNIEVGADGKASLEILNPAVSLGDGESSAMGKAVVIHAGADDYRSQPSGDAGGRIACGVVR